MWLVRVHVVSKLCHNEEGFNLSQQISRLNKKYILTQVCCIEYDQKKQVLCNYAISENGTYIDSWQGQCGKFISCTLQILFSISSCKEFMVILKLIFFKFQGPLPHTANHFWQMIWEQNTAAIIMLNKVVEKNQASTNLIIDFYI